jgi:hypothetical protein
LKSRESTLESRESRRSYFGRHAVEVERRSRTLSCEH